MKFSNINSFLFCPKYFGSNNISNNRLFFFDSPFGFLMFNGESVVN